MGCDIHMHYEIRNGSGWKHFDHRAPYAIGKYSDGGIQYDYDKLFDDPLEVGRNYNLFSVLADVRNGEGFAGCYTGGAFEPIALPRGLPVDVSSEVKQESDEFGVDGHSHSWLTLSEVMDYDYSKERESSGVVSPQEFATFVEKGKPDGWCGDVSGMSVAKISPAKMMDFHRKGYPEDGKHYYTRVSWRETYRDAIGDDWFKTMQALADQFGKDNVRLVFWFDN